MAASVKSSLSRWLHGSPEEDVLRWLYRGLLAATVLVLAFDYSDLRNTVTEKSAALPASEDPFTDAPSATPLPQTRKQSGRPAPLRETNGKLREKMTFELESDGRLTATGTIFPGTAKRFADEVGKRGSYVKSVVLQSPGGSVQDALAMGKLIREKGFGTEVESGRYCASSCPLVFAGGVERRAGAKSAIGVHQVFAPSNERLTGAAGMEHAQLISAVAQKYLRTMGVDLQVWVHAMETPHNELYYFTPKELSDLKLATVMDQAAPRSARR